jgi:hypothetical protein
VNTAAVTIMSAMFQSASRFHQAIGTWNTAAVTTTNAMFYSASSFDQAIGKMLASLSGGLQALLHLILRRFLEAALVCLRSLRIPPNGRLAPASDHVRDWKPGRVNRAHEDDFIVRRLTCDSCRDADKDVLLNMIQASSPTGLDDFNQKIRHILRGFCANAVQGDRTVKHGHRACCFGQHRACAAIDASAPVGT